MTVETLISNTTPPLREADSVEFGLGLMMESRVRHLPVIDDAGHVIGVLSEDTMLDASGPDALVETLLGAEALTVGPQDHVFDVASTMMEHALTTIPVTDASGQYVGLLRRTDLFEWFARLLSTQEPGAILALEIDERDYALSQVIYAIEQNDVKVLSLSTAPSDENDGRICITLKLNTKDAARVRHLLEHHGYRVVAAFGEDEDEDDLSDRVQEFLRYLEV
jgi:acetoin utilization protein AcuB